MKTEKLLVPGVLLLAMIITGLYGCTESQREKKEAPASVSVTDYPYTIARPDNWEIGDNANTLIALKSLKAWEEGKMDEALKYFADTIRVELDGLDKKMPNDSLKAMFTSGWNNYKTIKERLTDWESVISKDKSEEWVTLWYVQTWETKAGVKDSLAVVNDLQIKNGKIIRLSEYSRKFH